MPTELAPLFAQLPASNPERALDMLRDYAVSKVGDRIFGMIWRSFRRVVSPGYKSESEIQREDIETLKRVVDGLVHTMAPTQVKESLNSDRATEAFVSEAVESALESPFAPKHLLLGRLIGERVTAETESREDLFLREALTIVEQANQQQLFALGALYLIHHPPESFMPIESLVAWWDTEYLPLLQRFISVWDGDDLDYLDRLGAIAIDRVAQSPTLRLGAHAGAPIDGVLLRRGFGPAVSMSRKKEHESQFAVYSSRLYAGTAKTTARPSLDIALSPYTLTKPRRHVALTVINALSTNTIEESRAATAYPIVAKTNAH